MGHLEAFGSSVTHINEGVAALATRDPWEDEPALQRLETPNEIFSAHLFSCRVDSLSLYLSGTSAR